VTDGDHLKRKNVSKKDKMVFAYLQMIMKCVKVMTNAKAAEKNVVVTIVATLNILML
jgi:hypothetical protein